MRNDELLEVHVWTDTAPFSVMIYVRDQEQKERVRYIEHKHKQHALSTETMCKWMILCGVDYKILKPFHKVDGVDKVYQIIQERLERFRREVRRA